MFHQTVEAVFPFRNLPPKPKAKPVQPAATAEAVKAPAWDSAAVAAQAAAEAEAAARAAASALDLGGGGASDRPVSPLPHPMAVTPEDLLFFSPGDRILVLQQFRGSPWWLGAVKLCSQEQAHSRLRALERLNAAATHSEIASSPILAKASTTLRARAKSINSGAGGGPPSSSSAASPPLGGSGDPPPLTNIGTRLSTDIEHNTNSNRNGGDGGDAHNNYDNDTDPEAGTAAAALVAAGRGGGGGGLTNDSITAKLVRHASRRSVAQQLDAAQKEVTMQNSFANMKMAFGEEVTVEGGDEGMAITSPPLSYEGSPTGFGPGAAAAGGRPPRAGAPLFSLDGPMERSIVDHNVNGNAEDTNILSNSSFSFRPGGGNNNNANNSNTPMNASFAGGGMLSNTSFFINRDLGNAMEKALLEIPGNYNAGKPYDSLIDGELFNFKSSAAVILSPDCGGAGSPLMGGMGGRRSSNLNASFSGLPPMNHSFRLGGGGDTNPLSGSTIGASPLLSNSNSGVGHPPTHHHGGGERGGPKTIYRLDAYKIGLFYVPFTRTLDDVAKLSTTATEDGRNAKDSLLKDVTKGEKGPNARVSAGDGGVVNGQQSSAALSNDARTFSVPMEAKTSALRTAQARDAGAADVKYHSVATKVSNTTPSTTTASAAAASSSGGASVAEGEGSGGGNPSMYYTSSNAASAGRGRQQQMSDDDDRRLRKLLGLDDGDDTDAKNTDASGKKGGGGGGDGKLANDDRPSTANDFAGPSAALLGAAGGSSMDFGGSEFRRALIEMQQTSDNSHTQEQLDAARIRLLRTVISSTESSFDRAATTTAAGGNNNSNPVALMTGGGGSSGGGGDAIHEQITNVHRQLLDKAVGLRTGTARLARDAETLRIREAALREAIAAEARLGRGGSMRRANIVTSLLPEKEAGGDDDDDGHGFLDSLGGSVRAGSPQPTNPSSNNNGGVTPLEAMQFELNIMKAKLKLCTHRREQASVRVDVLNCFADGVEEDAPQFNAHAAVEKETLFATELAEVLANGGRPPRAASQGLMGSLSLAGSAMEMREGSVGGAGNGLNASFGGAAADSASAVDPDRPPSPPTEAALIEEPKAKKLLKKVLKRMEEADLTLEDYEKQKKKIERRIEKNGAVLKEVAKAIAAHTTAQAERERLISEALGGAGGDGGDGYEDPPDDEDSAIARADLPAPELPPTMGAAAKKKAKNAVAAAEEESDPQLAKCPAEVRHAVKMLLFDPAAIPEHQQSVEMIGKCMAAVEKLTSKAKKALKSSTANAEATAGLKAERDKIAKKLAKGDAATLELERTIRITQQEIDGIKRQAVNAKAGYEAAEKELAAKRALSAEVIRSWAAKQKEAGRDIEALKAKIASEKERVAKFEAELKQLEEKRAAAEAAEAAAGPAPAAEKTKK